MTSIARRLAIPFVAFVVAGSLALVVWLGLEEWRESREQFAAMARTNAQFIRAQNLPRTEPTASALGKILGVDVRFYGDGGWQPQWPPDTDDGMIKSIFVLQEDRPGVVEAISGQEVITMTLDKETFLVFSRPADAGLRLWARPRTFVILGAFWLLSLALAAALARGIVRPLRTLATRLPRISQEKDEPLPETARTDEIGQLARAYAETRAQLVTERRAREQAERLATLGRMATGLAHEINNPVSAIRLHAQLLESELPAGPAGAETTEQRQRLQIILAETVKIEGLVNQWMFLARPEPPHLAFWDLADLIASAIRTQAPAADHARVRFVNEVTPGLLVNADRRRLDQALTNIIVNAIHAMSANGGTLTITPAPGAHGSTVNVLFTDTGPGFSAAALARATELFFSEKEGGMGIGLNVAAEILKAHGGELRLANLPGGGAIVTVVLPAASASRPAHPAS